MAPVAPQQMAFLFTCKTWLDCMCAKALTAASAEKANLYFGRSAPKLHGSKHVLHSPHTERHNMEVAQCQCFTSRLVKIL